MNETDGDGPGSCHVPTVPTRGSLVHLATVLEGVSRPLELTGAFDARSRRVLVRYSPPELRRTGLAHQFFGPSWPAASAVP